MDGNLSAQARRREEHADTERPQEGQMMLAGGSRMEELATGSSRGEPELPTYTAIFGGERKRKPATRHHVLLTLCSAALVVCVVGGVMRVRSAGSAPSELSSKLMFGAGVGDDNIANSILNDARAKYEASKQRLAAKAAAPVKPSAAAAAAPSAKAPSPAKAAKSENALTLEEKIAQHKITTRDLVKEVQARQKEQAKAMAGQLQDQTDDLIVASIKAMKKKETSSTTSYVLNNALTKTEKQSLAHGGAVPEAATPAAPPAPQAIIDAKVAPAAAQQPQAAKQAGVHPLLMETPPGGMPGMPGMGNKKKFDTHTMLSSYDQQILKMGPDGGDSGTDSELAAAPMAPSASQPAPAYPQPAPQYVQPQYQAPPYQQLAYMRQAAPAPMPAATGPYAQPPMYQAAAPYGYEPQQPAPYQGYPAPQYAYQPAAPYNGIPMSGEYRAPGAQPQYSQYPGQQLYAAPPAPYGYAQPEYAQQPYEQAYGYRPPQYGQYQQLPQQPPQYAQAPQYAQRPAAAPAPSPTPAQLLAKAKWLEAHPNGGPAPQQAASPSPPPAQSLAAYTTAGPGGSTGGGLLWRMFTAPESPTAPPAAAPQPQPAAYQQPPPLTSTAPAMSLAQSMGAGSMAYIDPQKLGVGSHKDAVASLSMSSSAKQSIKAKMMALRQGIMNDFRKTTDIGAQAGYLPPVGE